MVRARTLLPLFAAAGMLAACSQAFSPAPETRPPVMTDMDAIIVPPPTGDTELIRPPPSSASKMPVIKPQAAPPVIPKN